MDEKLIRINNSAKNKQEINEVKKDRIEHWISVGAQLSDTVSRLLGDFPGAPKKIKKSSNQGIEKKDRKKENSSES